MKAIKILAIVTSAIIASWVFSALSQAVEPIEQNPPMILGFRLESVSEIPPVIGENLFDPDGWIVTYGSRENCFIDQSNGVITMTKNIAGWPPCGVSQKIMNVGAGSKFLFSAEVLENTDFSEVYTDFDLSLFKPGTGTRTDVITSKYQDLTVWLQTYSKTILPITTKWSGMSIKRIE